MLLGYELNQPFGHRMQCLDKDMRCSWGSGTMVPWGWGTILWSQRAQVLWAWALICHGTRGQRSCGSGRSCDTGVQVFRCSGVQVFCTRGVRSCGSTGDLTLLYQGHQAAQQQGAPAKTGMSENHMSKTMTTINCGVNCEEVEQCKHGRQQGGRNVVGSGISAGIVVQRRGLPDLNYLNYLFF